MTDATMLERAAMAAYEEAKTDEAYVGELNAHYGMKDPLDVPSPSKTLVDGFLDFEAIARAVLLSVRNPDQLMENVTDMEWHPSTNFTAMIDAILADGEGL